MMKKILVPLVTIILCLYPLYLFLYQWPCLKPVISKSPELFGKMILNQLPENSEVYVRTVYTDFILLYLQHVEGYRRDIQVKSLNRKQDFPPDWLQQLKYNIPLKNIFAEYDFITRAGFENQFYPAGYFGRLIPDSISSFENPVLNENNDKWKELISKIPNPSGDIEPVIISDYHPFAVAKANLSVIYAHKGLWDKGFEESYHSSELEPGYSEPYLLRGIWYLNQEQLEKAQSELKTYVRLNPISHDGWLNLGTSHAKLSQLNDAIICFRKSVAVDPKSPDGYTSLGIAYMQTKNYSLAESSFKTTVYLNPQNPAYWGHLGRVLAIRGKNIESKKAWEKILELDPANLEAKSMLNSL